MSCTGSASGRALLTQATERWPSRKRGADGMCPSKAHTTVNPRSWHEPNAQGISRAVDLTHDPASGCDCAPISEHLRVTKDRRVRRCIFNRRQWYAAHVNGYAPYVWQPYGGTNPHTGHMHLDLLVLDDTSDWLPEEDDDVKASDRYFGDKDDRHVYWLTHSNERAAYGLTQMVAGELSDADALALNAYLKQRTKARQSRVVPKDAYKDIQAHMDALYKEVMK